MADVKGDLASPESAGREQSESSRACAKELKIDNFTGEASPVVFWDVFGEQGHPVRATISEMGPLLLGRLLELNDTTGRRTQHRFQNSRRKMDCSSSTSRTWLDVAVTVAE